jgi:hypothetical protein
MIAPVSVGDYANELRPGLNWVDVVKRDDWQLFPKESAPSP